ncbi:hypothetical protein Q1695_000395 [Nippostrongylus brasiliensis]|nr:hypothetical protein Q1695_000395 [Nippostrongylus brasiliensis]
MIQLVSDLKCNETFSVDESEKNKESVVRRVAAAQGINHAAFRPTYNSAAHPVKYTIQTPSPRPPYSGMGIASHLLQSSDPYLSSADQIQSSVSMSPHSLQNTSKLYKPASSALEHASSAGMSPSQLQIFAGSTLQRCSTGSAGLEQQYCSTSSTSGRPPSVVPLTAVHAAAIASRTGMEPIRSGAYHAHIMCKNVPQLQQSPTLMGSRPPIAMASHVVGRSPSQNGLKQSSSPSFIRASQPVTHNVTSQKVVSPCRFGAGFYHHQSSPMSSVISGSPGPPQPLPQIISTPSPRPSILRKSTMSTTSAAKRRLPFMKEESSSPSSSAPVTLVRSAPITTQAPQQPKESPKASASGESPRKRMRKQQFETDATPDQIKMAIDVVQPIVEGSDVWKYDDHAKLMGSLSGVGIPEKRKRGRPRTSSRPATVLPIELHQSVSVFVALDSPEEIKKSSFGSDSLCNRGSASSVPPVHLKIPAVEKVESDTDVKEETYGNSGKLSAAAEEGVAVLKQWHREKVNSSNSSRAQKATAKQKSRASVSNIIGSPAPTTSNELVTEEAVDVLRGWIRDSQGEKNVRQEIREVTGLSSSTSLPTVSANGLVVTMFQFKDAFGKHCSLEQLYERESELFSSQCIKNAAETYASSAKPIPPANVDGSDVIDARPDAIHSNLKTGLSSLLEGVLKRRIESTDVVESAPLYDSDARKEVEQLLDEIITFIVAKEAENKESNCAKRDFVRESTGRTVGTEYRRKEEERFLRARRSRARMLLADSFQTILNNLKSSTSETSEKSVFEPGAEARYQSWWDLVCAKKESKETPLIDSPVADNLNSKVPTVTVGRPVVKLECSDDVSDDYSTIWNEDLATRLQQMNENLKQQVGIERNTLRMFEHMYKTFSPEEYWNMHLDMQRDSESLDLETVQIEKRMQRLRVELMRPPVKLLQVEKPSFGERCGSVICCPTESEMNQYMLDISPFWRGAVGGKNCYYTRTGKMMRDRDSSYVPLGDDYKEYYLEDLVDYCDPNRFRKDYAQMERTWSALKSRYPSVCTKDFGKHCDKREWMSRRDQDKLKNEDVVCLGAIQREMGKCSENAAGGPNDEEFAYSKELLATAFKAIGQTTLLMLQSRNAILDLVHNIVEETGVEYDDDLDDSLDDEEEYSRQLGQAIQESCQELQSSSRAQS